MSYRHTLYLLLSAVVASLVVVLYPHTSRDRVAGPPSSEAAEESAGRGAWEVMRLRDPATGRIPEGILQAERRYAATIPARQSAFAKGMAGALDYSWRWRGPFNIGGRTRALALDVTGEDTILAGGVTSGMWRSIDGGASWTRTTRPGQLPSVTTIAQDVRPGRTNTWYIGTGEIIGGSASASGAYYSGDGLMKSIDNGRTWEPLASTVSSTYHLFDRVTDYIWRVVVDRSDTGIGEIYTATYGGIQRSSNAGASWTSVLMTGTNQYSPYTDVAIADDGVVYATLGGGGDKRGIYRSVDGRTWTKIQPVAFPIDSANRIVMAIAPSNPNVVYFLGETPGFGSIGRNFRGDTSWNSLWRYTYLSGDGSGNGGEWVDLSANLPRLGGSFGDFFCQNSYDLHVAIKPDDPSVVFIGGTNLYRSTDGFATPSNISWIGGYRNIMLDSTVIVDLEYPEHHPDQHWMLFSRGNSRVAYTASDGGVHRTDDVMAETVAWHSLNAGYRTSQFYTVAIDHATPGDDFLLGGLQDNGTWSTTSDDPTATWRLRGTGDGSWCSVVDGGNEIYVSKQLGKTYRVVLDDDGNAIASTRIDPLGGTKYLFINPFLVDPLNQRVLYLPTGGDLWRNSDVTSIPIGSTQPATAGWQKYTNASVTGSISAFGAGVDSSGTRLYYGTSAGDLYRMDGAQSGDPTPTKIDPASFPAGYINCITVDPLDPDRVIVVFSNYSVQSLWLTTDGGANWTPIGGTLEQNPSTGAGAGPSCRWVSILHRSNGTLYLIATSTGLYSTKSLSGTTTRWEMEAPDLIGNMPVAMVTARQSDGVVAVATHGMGIFTGRVEMLGVEEGGSAAANALQVSTYPNPARSHATIGFTIPGDVPLATTVDLHDLSGNRLGRVFEGRTLPGKHTARIDFDSPPFDRLPSGTYFFDVAAGSRRQTGTIHLAR